MTLWLGAQLPVGPGKVMCLKMIKNGEYMVYHQYIKKWQSESRQKEMNNGRHAKIIII